jgi:glycosyltransferase involved in cell wall biosynthesis
VNPELRRAALHPVAIERAISPLADLRALLQLTALLTRIRPAAVHSLTPKAGLVAAFAAFIARVPMRTHTFTGQVWATRSGLARTLLRGLDGIIPLLDTHVLADSASQLAFLRAEGVLGRDAGQVIGKGSVAGVDAQRFRPDPQARAQVRAELDIPSDATVFLFAGRLNRDKGVLDLADAFSTLARARDDVFLLLVGPDEGSLAAEIAARTGGSSHVRFAGWTEALERYMAASDVFCLPSHREGFGAVIIEAAAAGLPSIGSHVYGITDAIEDGLTGVLVPPGDAAALAAAMRELAGHPDVRIALGTAARARALRDFSADALSEAFLDFYRRALPVTKERPGQEPPARGV